MGEWSLVIIIWFNELYKLYDYDPWKSIQSMFNFKAQPAACSDIYLFGCCWLFQPLLSWRCKGDPLTWSASAETQPILSDRVHHCETYLSSACPLYCKCNFKTENRNILDSSNKSFPPRLTLFPLISNLQGWKTATRIIYSHVPQSFSHHDTHRKCNGITGISWKGSGRFYLRHSDTINYILSIIFKIIKCHGRY